MIKSILYNYYYRKFMNENNKVESNIDWGKWNKLNQMCEKYF